MANSGEFKATIQLNLVNCDSLPPFNETVEFEKLNGASCFSKHVLVPKDPPQPVCLDVAKACNQDPKLLVLRPMSVQFDVLKETKPEEPPPDWDKPEDHAPGPWIDVGQSGITRDKLAELLSFKTNAAQSPDCTLGRPQFYFDGLLTLLFKGATTQPVILTFTLKEWFGLDKDGKEILKANAKKRLHAVAVQIIAAYAAQPPAAQPPAYSAAKP